jgi:ATP-dependent DNA helicase RecQ
MIEKALTALRRHFGFTDFREGQSDVVESVLEGYDTVVVMPTGGGKSLCYQLPALMLEGATVVVSPLIALMKDQVESLRAKNISATFINSTLTIEGQRERITDLRYGQTKIVYVAPERFRSQHFVETLRAIKVSLFAVDEAHCISHWGHDFRPDYLRLKQAIQEIGRPQIIALTATATPYVRADIIEQLSLQKPRAFVSGFDRPNLTLDVIHTQKDKEKIENIRRLAHTHAGSGIVYASTRKTVEQALGKLESEGLSVVAYHAGMSDEERTKAQDDFMSDKVQMIVATNAFGMGVDKPDIRFVAHFQMPGSIEAYYQEIGRAGRDSLPATCALFFNYADKRTQDFFIEGSYPPPEVIQDVYQALVETNQQRMELSTKEIATRARIKNEMAVQSALNILEKAGHIERGASAENRASLRLLMSERSAKEKTGPRDTQARAILFALIESCELGDRKELEINVQEFSENAGFDLQATRRALALLAHERIISYTPARRTRGVVMLDDPPATRLRINPQDIARRAALEQRKLREMISFCYATSCYRAYILDYFGDTHHTKNCGSCGNCVEKKSIAISNPKQEPSDFDSFVKSQVPFARDLERDLNERARVEKARNEAEKKAEEKRRDKYNLDQSRSLDEEEILIVRKILACAARMKGKYGKEKLVGTLRGSKAKQIIETRLNELSTYGILAHLSQDEAMMFVDALVNAECLKTSGGAYPTIFITKLGEDVMRERQRVELLLKFESEKPKSIVSSDEVSNTIEETYALYRRGLSVKEISERRGLKESTIETHLADCVLQGRDVKISDFVSDIDKNLIEAKVKEMGVTKLSPIKEVLPERISYGMIRLVIANIMKHGDVD